MVRDVAAFAGARIRENPSVAAGICVFAFSFSLVAANALIGQTGGHPDPIWATRDPVTTRSVNAKPRPRERSVARQSLSPDRIPVPTIRPNRHQETERGAELVREAQAGLARLGYYEGTVDGIYGPHTREAVIEFQRSRGLQETGQVDAALLDAGIDAAGTARERDETPTRAVSVRAGLPDGGIRAQPAAAEDVRATALVARIQIGLSNFGETGITIDGAVDDDTKIAIRRFQARYNLPVDGEPSEELMRKLEEIGVLRSR